MSKHTTFNIGGPADYLIFPGSMDQLQAVVKLMNQCDIPFTILCGDKQFAEVIHKLFTKYAEKIKCQIGVAWC